MSAVAGDKTHLSGGDDKPLILHPVPQPQPQPQPVDKEDD